MLFCALKICARIACDCRDRGGEPRAVQIVGAGRVPGRGGGLLGVDEHVGGVVLDGLEGADGPAELLADLGVLDGHLQAGPADADRFGRRQDPEHRPRLAVRRRASTRSSSTVTPRSATDPTLRVVSSESSGVTVTPSAFGVDEDDVLAGGDHQHVGVRRAQHGGAFTGDDEVRADRDVARQGQRADRAAVGEPWK